MSVEEYLQWFRACGYEPTGGQTDLTIEMANQHGTYIMVTRPEELSPEDRRAAIDRYAMYLGIGYPPGGHGVH